MENKKKGSKDTLGDRMKGYENAYRFYLPRRMPVIIRIDGRAFHTFTRGLQKPFDSRFIEIMQETARELVSKVSGCKMGYVQSDEISLLVTNNDTLETEPWFANNLQKLVSLSASIATVTFNRLWSEYLTDVEFFCNSEPYVDKWRRNLFSATFDARAFILPEEEVTNYFIWRQQDAIRNSIRSTAQAHFSEKELRGVSTKATKEKLLSEKGIDWDKLPIHLQRGACVDKDYHCDIPVFTQDREFIEKYLRPSD